MHSVGWQPRHVLRGGAPKPQSSLSTTIRHAPPTVPGEEVFKRTFCSISIVLVDKSQVTDSTTSDPVRKTEMVAQKREVQLCGLGLYATALRPWK